MFKASPRRSPRSNMVKVKYAVQIFLLLGASLWLLYQVKHSRDQNPTLLESSSTSQKTSSGAGITKLEEDPPPEETIVEDGEEEAKLEEEEAKLEDGSGDFVNPDHETEDDTHRGLEMSAGDGATPSEAPVPENAVLEIGGAGHENATVEAGSGHNNTSGDEGSEEDGFPEAGKNRESMDFENAKAQTPGNAEEKEEERDAGEERERMDMASPYSLMETTRTDLTTLPDTGAATTEVETMAE